MSSTTDHLRRASTIDAGRPLLTFYDDASGERVELSGTTLANWVTKTVNLLTLTCDVEAGVCVSLHLPRHWVLGVWVLAADAVGATVSIPGPTSQDAGDIAVVGPDLLEDLPDADEVLACALNPLGAPFNIPLPSLVRDYGAEVRTMPDQPTGPVGPPGPLGASAETTADHLGLTGADRVMALGGDPDLDRVVRELLAPLAVGASAVWVRNPDRESSVRRWESERVTAVIAPVPAGLEVPEAVRRLP